MESCGSVDFLLGEFHLDPIIPCLYQVDKAGNAEVPKELSKNALKLLLLLVEREGQVVSHKEILKRVWDLPPKPVYNYRIHVLISELYSVLGRASIRNRPGVGYWIALKVRKRERPPDPEEEGPMMALYGMTPERLHELIKAAVSDAVGVGTREIDELSNRLKVTQDAAIAMLREIGHAEVPLERLAEKLAEVALRKGRAIGCRSTGR